MSNPPDGPEPLNINAILMRDEYSMSFGKYHFGIAHCGLFCCVWIQTMERYR